jgi:plasmid stabilization system protein ParE
MSVNLIVAPETAQDIDEAYTWYEQRRVGLGEEFLDCVDACIQFIVRWPESQAVVHATYRRALVRRFPYAVFYEVANDVLTVYAVFHTSRDPRKWRNRLP